MERGGGERLIFGEPAEQQTPTEGSDFGKVENQTYQPVTPTKEIGPAPATESVTEPKTDTAQPQEPVDFSLNDLREVPAVEDLDEFEDRITAHMERD